MFWHLEKLGGSSFKFWHLEKLGVSNFILDLAEFWCSQLKNHPVGQSSTHAIPSPLQDYVIFRLNLYFHLSQFPITCDPRQLPHLVSTTFLICPSSPDPRAPPKLPAMGPLLPASILLSSTGRRFLFLQI